MTLKCRMKFICTQGPMENTVRDFWHMIVQEGCRLILMLCNFREGLIFHLSFRISKRKQLQVLR
ncbi:hypothetical protein COOONC_08448 [Cooperia oncophora]